MTRVWSQRHKKKAQVVCWYIQCCTVKQFSS